MIQIILICLNSVNVIWSVKEPLLIISSSFHVSTEGLLTGIKANRGPRYAYEVISKPMLLRREVQLKVQKSAFPSHAHIWFIL